MKMSRVSISASIFKEWLHSIAIFDRHDIVSITTLEDDSNCSYSWDIGYKYTELANLYNKDSIDICSDGWEVWLSDSSFLTQLKNYIELSQTPISDSIVVYVNQAVTHDWTYNSDRNIVYLGFTPDYGALVEVGYEVES